MYIMGYRRCWTVAWKFLLLQLLLIKDVLSVAVTEVRLLSDSNRQEYVLHGEGATLSCHYVIQQSEKVTEVEWEHEGVLVYLWSLSGKPKAYDIFDGHVKLTDSSPSTVTITKVTMEMQGTYTCRVRTNGKTAQNEAYLMVIVDACSDSSWKTHTDMITCTETINMHCVGIYPKPSPACGVYSELSGKFLSSVPFDSVNMLFNRTYEVSVNRRFKVEEWINHTDISFRCHMLVLGTTWRSGIKHKMFGEPGCASPPPAVENGYYNLTEALSCWGNSGESSIAEYHCEEGFRLLGSALYTCREGTWSPEGVVVQGDYTVPVCSNSGLRQYDPIKYWTILWFFLTYLKWTHNVTAN